MPTRPLIEWPVPLFNLIEFLGAFLALGAIGFRYAVLRVARQRSRGDLAEAAVFDQAGRRAAAIGLIGTLMGLQHVWIGIGRAASRQHVTVAGLLLGVNPSSVWLVLTAVAIAGFVMVLGRRDAGWALAGIGVVFAVLRNALFGMWSRLVMPFHLLAGGLWLGTLFVLVVAGLAVVLREIESRDQRGAIAADMVNAFSPMALTMGAVVAFCGLYLGFGKIERLEQLWTTPYGNVLALKAAAVAVVFTFGAWNWRRAKPKLGSEAAARSLLRTASGELMLAFLVIAITAVLASLPDPPKPV